MSTPRIAILITGSEILDGRVLDTNTQYLASQLASLGLPVQRTLTVTDDRQIIANALRELREYAEYIIVSGGLGPTTDDVTRYAIADVCGLELKLDSEVRDNLKGYFEKRGRVFSEINERQALFPEPHVRIPNSVGTAPGFIVHPHNAPYPIIASLPGVPREMHAMLGDTVLPYLTKHAGLRSDVSKRFMRVFGLPESEVGAIIERCHLPESLFVSYRAAFPEIHLKFVARGADREAVLEQSVATARNAISAKHVITEAEADTIDVVIRDAVVSRRLTLAVAESCTGGMLGALLTNAPGASEYFVGGVISYSNELKSKLLGVDPELITKCGAVSAEVAAAMADGARLRLGSDCAIALTGVAGPDGGSAKRPVGTVFVGIATPRGSHIEKIFYPGTRERVRRYAAHAALTAFRNLIVS